MPRDVLCYSIAEAQKVAAGTIADNPEANIKFRRLGGYILVTVWVSDGEPTSP
jgi:hypothetical protein